MNCTKCNKNTKHFKSTSTKEDGLWVTRRYFYCEKCKLGFIESLKPVKKYPAPIVVDDVEVFNLNKKVVTLDNFYE